MRAINVRSYMRNGKMVKAHTRGGLNINFKNTERLFKTGSGVIFQPEMWGETETGFNAKVVYDPDDPHAGTTTRRFYKGANLYKPYKGHLGVDTEAGKSKFIADKRKSADREEFITRENRKYYEATRKKKR